MDSLVGLDEVVVSTTQNRIGSTIALNRRWNEFEPETEQMHKQELTNLRKLEWLHDLPADPKETILTIQGVNQKSIKYISLYLTQYWTQN